MFNPKKVADKDLFKPETVKEAIMKANSQIYSPIMTEKTIETVSQRTLKEEEELNFVNKKKKRLNLNARP